MAGKPKHGQTHTATYKSWEMMIQRCHNPLYEGYSHYGAKGIEVCPEWRKFSNFYKDMGDRPEGTTLDRIDSLGGYFKDNCRWATKHQQSVNRGKPKTNTSGVKGVYWHGGAGKWMAAIGVNRKNIYLGLFNSKEDAAAARIAAEKLYFNN